MLSFKKLMGGARLGLEIVIHEINYYMGIDNVVGWTDS